MTKAQETRRSPPVPTDDRALEVKLAVESPLTLSGDTVDASRAPFGEPIRVATEVKVDWDMLEQSTRFRGAKRVLLVSRCSDTRWSSVTEIGEQGDTLLPGTYSSTLTISRGDVFRRVACEVVVVLDEPHDVPDEGSRPGRWTVVARRGFSVQLKKGGFEFPTRWVSFADPKYRYPAHALWVLSLDTDAWHAPARDAVVVLLNEDRSDFYKLLQAPRKDLRAAADVLYAQIAYDCLATLIHIYLTGDISGEPVDPHGESLADVVNRTAGRLLGEGIDRARVTAKEDPGQIRVAVQGAMRLEDMML